LPIPFKVSWRASAKPSPAPTREMASGASRPRN